MFSSSSSSIPSVIPFFQLPESERQNFAPGHQPVKTQEEFINNLNKRYQCEKLNLDKLQWKTTETDKLTDLEENMKTNKKRWGFHSFFFDKLKWKTDPQQPYSDYLLCGGSALNAMHAELGYETSASSDLDIFVLGNNDESARCAAFRLVQHFAKLCTVNSWDILFAEKGNLIYVWLNGLPRVIQIVILPDCKTYDDVLNNFDQSCCGWGYDGKQVWCSQEALNSMRTGINITNEIKYNRLSHYNPDKSNIVFARRIRKMVQRGFQTSFPALDFMNKQLYPDLSPEEIQLQQVLPVFEKENFKENQKLISKAYECKNVTMNPLNVRFKSFFIIKSIFKVNYSPEVWKRYGLQPDGVFRDLFNVHTDNINNDIKSCNANNSVSLSSSSLSLSTDSNTENMDMNDSDYVNLSDIDTKLYDPSTTSSSCCVMDNQTTDTNGNKNPSMITKAFQYLNII